MNKELLKRFTMLALLGTLALATAVASKAQSADTQIVADIPFQFTVGDRAMPSGKYAVQATSSHRKMLLIQSADAKCSAIGLTNSIGSAKANERAKLVFHRYGERYFLAEVWSGGSDTGRELWKSRQERAIERELASTRLKSQQAQSSYESIEVLAALR